MDSSQSFSIRLSGKFITVTVIHDSLLNTNVDAIVNAANCEMRGGGGINGAIQQKAGPELLKSLEQIAPNGCPTGEVVTTEGFNTGFKYIFHTPGPVWKGGQSGEPELLSNSYWNCLNEANTMGLKSIGFCSISTGIYGYPLQAGANIAIQTLIEYITSAINDVGVFNLDEIVFATFLETEYDAFTKALQDIFVPWTAKKSITKNTLINNLMAYCKSIFGTETTTPEPWNDQKERELLKNKEPDIE